MVKQLRQLRTRPERERSGTFYVEGVRIVAQAARSNWKLERCVIAPTLLVSDYGRQIVEELRSEGTPVTELSAEDFGSISFKENLQGIGAVVRSRMESLDEVYPSDGVGWVALDSVGNPGNLGAILRTCDAVGCDGILLLGDTTDPYHPAAVRASMGAIFAQRLVRARWDEFLRWKAERGYHVTGTSGTASQEYREVSYPSPLVLLMGSERQGLSVEQQGACDLLVRIPMVGTGDSLNLGVATSLMLYEVFHQRRSA